MKLLTYWFVTLLLMTVVACDTVRVGGGGNTPIDPPGGTFQLTDGVVVGPDGGTLYVLTVERALAAIDGQRGNARWTRDLPLRPITLVADGLITQSLEPGTDEPLTLVTVAASDGREVNRASVTLPPDLTVDYLRDHPGTFTLSPFGGTATPSVAWLYRPLPRKGAYDPGEEEEIFNGTFRITDGGAGFLPVSADAPGERAGRSVVPPAAQRIAGREGQQYLSRDGRHLLVSQKRSADDPATAYRWEIYRSGEAEPLGQLSSRMAYLPFYVRDGILYFVEGPYQDFREGNTTTTPYQLVAYDLPSGRRRWTRALQDPIYRGPRPS
ncbi:hypothetical protein [Lewinella sp. IMCC34183]|uniref:hypothetical protein n=1 Tax=Lewinella sp. IMCC34183 TaxID=2248762 RepID=UPI000E22D1AF|nr:hypothetical protein [Lewinella sp. IMCC34183]